MLKGILKIMLAAAILFALLASWTMFTPVIRAWANGVDYATHKIDDATRYDTKKQVEDTCRAMMSSYNSDKMVYEMYWNSQNPKKQEWAEQARMRANNTASSYNNYILENSYVWKGNIPKDIDHELAYLTD